MTVPYFCTFTYLLLSYFSFKTLTNLIFIVKDGIPESRWCYPEAWAQVGLGAFFYDSMYIPDQYVLMSYMY
jgi:hypothetical protein